MRKLWMLVALVLIFALQSGTTFAGPAASADTPAGVVAFDTSGAGGDDDNGDEAKKAKKSRSHRDRLDRRNSKRPARKPSKKPKYKKWKEVLEDAEKHEGLFNVHTKREDVFFEIKEDQLDKPHLALMSLSKGIGARFVLGGMPIAPSVMFDFHRVEDHIQIRQLNMRFRSNGDPALDQAVDLSYGNSVLFQLPIESENEKEKSLLINMNKVFLSDISDMGFLLQLVLKKPVRMDQKKAVYRKVKAFPKNIEVEALLTYSPGDRRGLYLPSVPDSRFIELGVHYSIHSLPEEPMKPRLADDRIGYFMTPHKDFSKDTDESFFVHYVNRWRLEKMNPSADMSEPKEPIVFYLDHTIPKKYRRYVAEGIELWQKAFEAAGYRNAIIAKDPSEDDPDFDPEDARYNTIRWIISDEPAFGAIGPSRVDPRTGEILDADILMEQNMIAGFRKIYRRLAGPEAISQMDPMLRFLENPSLDPEAADFMQLQQKLFGLCDIGFGFANGFDFMSLALLADGTMRPGMDVPMEYVGEAIRFVTAHEVGHTLGMRHNFKSSISTPYDKLNDRYTISEIGMTGSIMDYPSPNVAVDRKQQGYYYSPSVGTYDQWAIKWAYTEVPGDMGPKAEAEALKSIASEASLPEHAYGTDYDTYPAGALDPHSSIWDLGDNQLRWAKDRVTVCKNILEKGNLESRVVAKGESYVPLRYAVVTLLVQEYLALSKAVKYVGGQYTARPHRGVDGGQLPLDPVPASEQTEALNFLIEHAFSKDAFTISPVILNKLGDDKLQSWQNNLYTYGRRFDFPMVGWVAGLQNALLNQLLQPMLLQRAIDGEYKVSEPYRLSAMFRTLTASIWTNNMTPVGNTALMQRNLQRIYLDKLIHMVVRPYPGTPHEAVALARLNLTRIRSAIDTAYKRKGLNDETNAHLGESNARIARALDAKLEAKY
jgi:hypothetical protein